MATVDLYNKVVSTLEGEIQASNEALGSDAYHRFQSNLDMLKSAYVEGYGHFVSGAMETYDQLLKEIDSIQKIPETLAVFKVYWESAKQ